VTVRSRYRLAVALGLSLLATGPGWAAEPTFPPGPAVSPASNQDIADAIADRLRQSPLLRDYSVTVSVTRDGVELRGEVVQPEQHKEAVRLVAEMPGVVRVVDLIRVVTPARQPGADLVRVQGFTGLQLPGAQNGAPPVIAPPPTPVPTPGAPGVPAFPGVVPGMPGTEAVPSFQAPAPSAYALNPPRMPPYAWPTYAPYNNYSRVGYPNAYPYNAWPFIGPIYPFPKVPLGWRAIKLEWEDGYWWYSKLMPKYDWWRLRYY
jgi:hypothetical protein